MKIAVLPQPMDVVLPPNPTSIGVCVYETARRLSGFDVTVYTGTRAERSSVEEVSGIRLKRIPVRWDLRLNSLIRKLPFYGKRRPPFSSRFYYHPYIIKTALDLRQERFDVIHIHSFSQFVPVVRAFNPSARILLHVHGAWLTEISPEAIRPCIKKADVLIGCSSFLTDGIKNAFPELSERCHTVHNGVDPALFSFHGSSALKNAGPKLLFVSRISPEKGVHVLLGAFERISKEFPGTSLDIIGPEAVTPIEYIVGLSNDKSVKALERFYRSGYQAHLESMITARLKDKVRFIGNLPHSALIDHYRGADIFVNASFSESFGMPIIEAMSAGLPVVAAKAGGIREVVDDGKTGILVEPGDENGLADAVIRLLKDERRRRSMGEAGRGRVLKHFTWDKVSGDLERLYSRHLKRA
ncbi:MAG: glycosyltransferase family 4 protein [Deltaproteobacteria bacterium]|nr:glycosyltransferase family 4 protein [Deltaproteobacteria bacterium]